MMRKFTVAAVLAARHGDQVALELFQFRRCQQLRYDQVALFHKGQNLLLVEHLGHVDAGPGGLGADFHVFHSEFIAMRLWM